MNPMRYLADSFEKENNIPLIKQADRPQALEAYHQ